MILYTMMPQELVYPQNDYEDSGLEYIKQNGVSLCVSKDSVGEYKIERVMSTDPQHFLNDKYAPGSRIQL
ncbi:YlzJ-like family protein [Fredinandcohnia sp. 179-A 10B2 NHS]